MHDTRVSNHWSDTIARLPENFKLRTERTSRDPPVRPTVAQRFRTLLHRAARRSGFGTRADEIERRLTAGQATQVLLGLHYRALVAQGQSLPAFADVEFRAYSQNGEDGILLYLFSLLGAQTRRCVELCAGDGIQCNTANLIVNHGWDGLLIDGDGQNVASARTHYTKGRTALWYTPSIVQSWVTAENVNELLREHGFVGEVDLLSIDMDGIDYWIWKAIDCIRPRVVVAEFNWLWGPHESKTVPYDPSFNTDPWTPAGWDPNFGASLSALTKLGREKGYRLVGIQRSGFNAFFVSAGAGEDLLSERSPEQCFETPSLRTTWSPGLLDAFSQTGWITV